MDDIPLPRDPAGNAVIPTDDEGLDRARIRFLTAERVERGRVRAPILASWWRSRRFHVPADRIDLPFTEDRDLDTPLIHGAKPLLDRLGEQLDGQPISLILTDPTGVVLTQHTGDEDLRRHLEGVYLTPGFSYAEQFVGTNGIGTALEGGGPMHVFGHEHYAENLENLACAGVPIYHPITGKTVGAVDLTCWRKDAGRLLVALARTTAEQVQQALLTNSSLRELELFQAYLQTCRRVNGIVIAFNDDVVMTNEQARQLLTPTEQVALLEQARQALVDGRQAAATVFLPTGNLVRIRCRRVPSAERGRQAGGVLCGKPVQAEDEQPTGPLLPVYLPGVVGSAPVWARCCHEVEASFAAGEWLALTGEHGVGKALLARRVHQRREPTGRCSVVDVATATPESLTGLAADLLDDPPQAVVVQHADRLSGPTASALAAILREYRAATPSGHWAAITLTPEGETDPALAELLALFPRSVQVPPLRHHVDDVRELVPYFLSKLNSSGSLSCSPRAMRLLMRTNWPGNAAQLFQVLKYVAQHRRRTGSIQPNDLPAAYHTVNRRSLNHLESMERDAIVQSLQDAQGNKREAAKNLGISRATIYRKIHEYGIVTPDSTH